MFTIGEIRVKIACSEEREKTRFDHYSPLRILDLKADKVYYGKMINFSNGGINFVSNSFLQEGAKVYFSMQNSPYDQSSDVLEYYLGKIMWRKYLDKSFFDYRYGIQFVSDSSNQDSEHAIAEKDKDSRRHSRSRGR